DKPYYQLTNFYASPIECELPIQVIDGSFRYMPLDIKGNLSSGGDYKGNGVYVELNGLVGEGLKGFNFLAMAINKIRNIPNPGEAQRPTSLSWDSTVVVPMRLRAMRFA
ncbi:3338_t:CDS:2, partial [Funneliformis geosporum]